MLISASPAMLWYLLLSAPGAIYSIGLLWWFTHSLWWPWSWFSMVLYGIVNPGTWVFPIIFGRQIYNLGARNFALAGWQTLVGCTFIVGLYVWWVFIDRNWGRMIEGFS
jgi:hypothetical protein